MSAFTVYDAAAGAGKTYTLVKNYLLKILSTENPSRFKQILAITFTNKAVSEMKARILESLHGFSQAHVSDDHASMFSDILQELDLSSKQLQKRSKVTLHFILHNYTSFKVETIDKFTQSVIRTFAHDLGLSTSFEVEINQGNLLEKAVDQLLDKIGIDPEITDSISNYARKQIEDDKQWNIKKSLLDVSKILFAENHKTQIDLLRDFEMSEFKVLRQKVWEKIKDNEKILIAECNEILEIFNENRVNDAFSRNTIPKHFMKLKANKTDTFKAKWHTNIEETAFYTKKCDETLKGVIDSLRPMIETTFYSTKDKCIENDFLKRILKNTTQLSLLKHISHQLDSIRQEENIIFISDFNQLISESIKEQPTPFIYERLGERFTDFFIDEFQDTSELQWNNLIPLCDAALSGSPQNNDETGSLTLVGDAKQSIYRWRGGKAEQFIALSNGIHPFSNESNSTQLLDTNYRSYSNVINFNNSFFSFVAPYFSNKLFADLYIKGNQQKTNNKKGGYIEFDFIEANNNQERNDLYPEKVLEKVKFCIDNGFNYEDISILIRTNTEGCNIANYLTEHKIPVVSKEALLIANANEVVFLINLVRLGINPKDTHQKLSFLKSCVSIFNIKEDIHNFLSLHITKSYEELAEKFGLTSHLDLYDENVYETFENLIRVFALNKTENVNLQFFMDHVFEYTKKPYASMLNFLEAWEKDKETLSVSIPKGINAVQILTIHKSKGLEFPIVIYPYADNSIYKTRGVETWVPLEGVDSKIKHNYIEYNENLFENYSPITQEISSSIKQFQELDVFNVLYVALTRAKEQLFIISNKKPSSKGLKEDTIPYLFMEYIEQNDQFLNKSGYYYWGDPKRISTASKPSLKEPLLYTSFDKRENRIHVVQQNLERQQTQAAKRYGILIHDIWAKIRTIKDFEEVLNFYKKDIDHKLFEKLKNTLHTIINDRRLSECFSDKNTIYVERDFSYHGQLLRPDRVEITPDKKIYIIDYKTGAHDLSHIAQIEEYASLFQDYEEHQIIKKLVYINEEQYDIIEV